MVIAMNVSAQSKTTAKSKTTTTTTAKKATTVSTAKKTTATTATAPAATTSTSTTAKTATATANKPTTTTTKATTASTSKPVSTKSSSSNFFSNAGDYDHGYHFLPEVKVGSFYGTGGWGVNLGLEHEFHKYFAWDIFSVDFGAPFNFDVCSVGLKTGIRAFSPYFCNDKLRIYSSLAIGYECGITKSVTYYDPWEDDWVSTGSSTSHGFALAWGIGTQIIKHLYIGYDLEYSTVWKSTAHFAKLGWRF
jgi:hypothetical protein